ncbi:MAG TPA: SET domain-containing protein-lysine N-methyltransferase [Candidatus Limnocylindria bacterium]|nr:SET domain-containing protein-lysine N-methyltransferase [Candidatus Limnocylindria bacterium]
MSGSYQSPKLKLRAVGRRERGVFAGRAIRKGEILTISGGVVLPYRKVRALPRGLQRLCFHIEHGFYLVPPRGRKVAIGFYMNHSCAPNAGDLNGASALTTVALRAIRRGEEVTCDYRTVAAPEDRRYRPLLKFRCRCGAKNCGGVIRA